MCYDMARRQTEVAGSIVEYGCSLCSGLRGRWSVTYTRVDGRA